MQNDYCVVKDNYVMFLIELFFRHEIPLKFEKYLDSYTEQQKKNWENSKKIVVYESREQLCKFIEDAKERKFRLSVGQMELCFLNVILILCRSF